MIRNLPDAASTERLAADLLTVLPANVAGWTLLLEGELGAGKSTFARGLLRAMGHDGPVPSPTYTLVEPYKIGDTTVYHVDLYRIGSEDELRFLGWSDLDEGLRIIEWPDRAPGLAETADLVISLTYAAPGRQAQIMALSARAGTVVSALASD